MQSTDRIYVAGSNGLVGSAIVRNLRKRGFSRIITSSSREVDLRDRARVDSFFESERPDYVFLAAAKVGGILANSTYPADFIRDNLAIQLNVIDAAYRFGVRRLQFMGSSCIYPKFATLPIQESSLMTGPLEPTNDAYAIAKIAGLKMCQAYRAQYGFDATAVMPTNVYGPHDHFDLHNSHVAPALIRKFCEAIDRGDDEVVLWGSGTPRREFIYVDDLADACVHLMEVYHDPEPINVGIGEDVTIRELAELIGRLTGFTGRLVFDASKPDGTPRKVLNVDRLHALGWRATTPLEVGMQAAIAWYREHVHGREP